MIFNLGNVVGLIKSTLAPVKKYVLWARVVDAAYPDEIELKYWNPNTASWELVNDSWWLPPVIGMTNTPPASPAIGDAYIIGTAGIGAWTGKNNQFATWLGHNWSYIVPRNGQAAKNKTDFSSEYIFDGSGWFLNLIGGGGTYSGATPTNTVVGAIPVGYDPTGKTALELWEKAMVTYLLPAFSSFLITGQPTLAEIGESISGIKTFTWGSVNNGNIQPNTIKIIDVTPATNLLTAGANDGSEALNIGTVVFTAAPRIYRIEAVNTNNAVFQRDFTIATTYPYFFGKVASGGAAAGANRPVINQALIDSGTKVVGNSIGTVAINFASTSDDYIWFAIPSANASKNVWFVTALNNGSIGGAVSPAGNLFPDLALLLVTTVIWSGIEYKVYLSNYQTASASNMELRN